MKKTGVIVATMIAMLSLTGCVDQMPDLTSEQNALISEYAADAVLKHAKNYQYPLEETDQIESSNDFNDHITEETKENQNEELHDDLDTETIYVEDTISEGPEIATTTGDLLTEAELSGDFSMDALQIICTGFSLCDTYASSGNGFALNAPKNRAFLVLDFMVTNETDEAINCDMFSQSPTISAQIGTTRYREIHTLLDYDLLNYTEQILPGEQKKLVAVFDVEQDCSVDDSFEVTINGATYRSR